MTTATQLTITIPEGAPAGSILSIPVKGSSETIRARVPEGLGPGCTLVLTKVAGSDQWIEESPEQSAPATQAPVGTTPLPQMPMQQGSEDGLVPDPQLGAALSPITPVAYTVRMDTTVGTIDIIVRPDWAPQGARRFLELAAAGDLEDLAFYRSVRGCLAQFGLPARRLWPPLPDDPPTGVPFLLGAVCFAAVGQNSRKSTLFICTGDMSHCFGQSSWETPIGAVAESSLDALDRIESCYGDIEECGGQGPNTGRIHDEGTAYLRAEFPRLTFIRSACCLDWPPPDDPHVATGGIASLPPALPAPTPRPVPQVVAAEPAAATSTQSVPTLPVQTQPVPTQPVPTQLVPQLQQQQATTVAAAAPTGRVASEVYRLEQKNAAVASSAPCSNIAAASPAAGVVGVYRPSSAAAPVDVPVRVNPRPVDVPVRSNDSRPIDVPIEIVSSAVKAQPDMKVVRDVPVEVCAPPAARPTPVQVSVRNGLSSSVGTSSMTRLGASLHVPNPIPQQPQPLNAAAASSGPGPWNPQIHSTTAVPSGIGPRSVAAPAPGAAGVLVSGAPCAAGYAPCGANCAGPCPARMRTGDSFAPPAAPVQLGGHMAMGVAGPMPNVGGAPHGPQTVPALMPQHTPGGPGFMQPPPYGGGGNCGPCGCGAGAPPLGSSFAAPVACGFPPSQLAPSHGAPHGPPLQPMLSGCPPSGRGPFDLPGLEQPGLPWPGAC